MVKAKPMSPIAKLTTLNGVTFGNPQFYRSVVGNLQYLAFTQLGISFAVNKVCQFMHSPKIPHWKVVKRILHFLQVIASFSLYFSFKSPLVSLPSLILNGLVALIIKNLLVDFIFPTALT